MALSLVVLLIPIALVLGMYRFLGHEQPPVIDPAPAYAAARSADEFHTLEAHLPDGWYVQSAQYQRESAAGVLRVGVRSAGGGAMQLVESATPAGTLVLAELGDQARAQDPVDVGGRSWMRYSTSRSGEHALVLTDAGRTVLVDGRAAERDLTALASSLS